MQLQLLVLVGYSLVLMAIGLVVGRRVRGAADFFVAGRRLGPGLIFSTMLAANIGAGSTVGATGIGYSAGLSGWWWVGSTGIGSLVLAFFVGPAIRAVAAERDLRTVGDYLEFRYNAAVRGIISALLWLGSIFILAGQLVALGAILQAVAGVPWGVGALIGGTVVVIYFTAGGLLTSAWVNVVQLTVKLTGFAIALPLAIAAIGGWPALRAVRADDAAYWNLWRASTPGLMYVPLLTPAFIVSPGLLQKIFGARDDRAVRLGVGLNAAALLLYAIVPVLLGIVARARFPHLAAEKDALPMLLVNGLPAGVGAVGLAAVFSAEISASDAVMLMLTTSLSQDLYKRFIQPSASDRQVLAVARLATVASGAIGVGLALVLGSVVDALTIFYTLLGVSLFVPIVAGLYSRRTSSRDALAAIVAGVAAMLVVQLVTGGRGWRLVTPAFAGIAAAVVAWWISLVFNSAERPNGGKRPVRT
jgi:SSS family solute:Na+ symporter